MTNLLALNDDDHGERVILQSLGICKTRRTKEILFNFGHNLQVFR